MLEDKKRLKNKGFTMEKAMLILTFLVDCLYPGRLAFPT